MGSQTQRFLLWILGTQSESSIHYLFLCMFQNMAFCSRSRSLAFSRGWDIYNVQYIQLLLLDECTGLCPTFRGLHFNNAWDWVPVNLIYGIVEGLWSRISLLCPHAVFPLNLQSAREGTDHIFGYLVWSWRFPDFPVVVGFLSAVDERQENIIRSSITGQTISLPIICTELFPRTKIIIMVCWQSARSYLLYSLPNSHWLFFLSVLLGGISKFKEKYYHFLM